MMITGWTDKDGNSITYETLGVFTDPNNDNEWSSVPYTKEQKKVAKSYYRFEFIFDKVKEHLTRTDRSILEEIELIKQKKSTLPRYAKDWLIKSQ